MESLGRGEEGVGVVEMTEGGWGDWLTVCVYIWGVTGPYAACYIWPTCVVPAGADDGAMVVLRCCGGAGDEGGADAEGMLTRL